MSTRICRLRTFIFLPASSPKDRAKTPFWAPFALCESMIALGLASRPA